MFLLVFLAPGPPAFAASVPAYEAAHREAAYQFVRGIMAASEGDFREALSAYAEAVELRPDEPYLRLEYGRLLARLGYFARSAEQRSQRLGLAAAQVAEARELGAGDLEVQREVGFLYLELANTDPSSLAAALEVLEEVRRQLPEDPDVLVQLGQIYRNQGRHDAATEAFREAVRAVPGNRWAASLLGKSLVELAQARLDEGRTAAAEEVLAELLALEPADRVARTTLADLQSRRGAHAEAAETLRGLPAEAGGDDLRPRLIWELYQAGAVSEARDELAAMIEADPSQAAVAGAVARELVRRGDEAQAWNLLTTLRERLEAGGGPTAGLRLELAELEAEAGRWQQAAALLEPLLGRPAAAGARGWRLLYSEALMQLGRGEEALELLTAAGAETAAEASEGAPLRAFVAKRAELLFRLERQQEALTLLAEMVRDGEAESLRQAARVHQRLERWEDAIPLLERLLTEQPESVEGLYLLGAAYERTGRTMEAESRFRQLLEQEPDFAPALNYLGYMWAERGENLEEALAMVNRAVDLEPDNGAYVDSLGWAHFQLGQYEQARAHLERASELEPDDPVIFEHLGDLYLALGWPDRAQEVYLRSLALGEENADEVRRKLERLGAEIPDGP